MNKLNEDILVPVIGVLVGLIIFGVCLYIDYGYKLSYVGVHSFEVQGITYKLALSFDGTGELSSERINYKTPISWEKSYDESINIVAADAIPFCIQTCYRGDKDFMIRDHKVFTNNQAAHANAQDPKYFVPLK